MLRLEDKPALKGEGMSGPIPLQRAKTGTWALLQGGSDPTALCSPTGSTWARTGCRNHPDLPINKDDQTRRSHPRDHGSGGGGGGVLISCSIVATFPSCKSSFVIPDIVLEFLIESEIVSGTLTYGIRALTYGIRARARFAMLS